MTSKHLLPIEDESELGPAMRECTTQERRFVHALFERPGHGAGARAARAAGYGNAGSPASTFARVANRLFNRGRVQKAIQEQTKALLRAEAPQAVQVVREIMKDKDHKDRLKAARTVLQRIDPEETKVDMSVTHRDERPSEAEEVAAFVHFRDVLKLSPEQLERLWGYSGISRIEALTLKLRGGPVIEGEYSEVPRDDCGRGRGPGVE